MISKDAYSHALREFPNESCGFLLHSGAYVYCENYAKDKTVAFLIAPKQFELYRKKIKAIVHSHPKGGGPSGYDKDAKKEVGIPYLILSINPSLEIEEFWVK